MQTCIPFKGESAPDVVTGSSNRGRPVSLDRGHLFPSCEVSREFGCSSFGDLPEPSHTSSLQFSGSYFFFQIDSLIFNQNNKYIN